MQVDMIQHHYPYYHIATKNNKHKYQSWALIEEDEDDPKEVKIVHIQTRRNQRYKGLASSLIKFLQKRSNKIITSCDFMMDEGYNLCIKNGFKHIKSMHKRKDDILIWTKQN